MNPVRVGVLRHTHGVPSEPFILEQARATGASLVLISRDIGGQGWAPAEGAVIFAAGRREKFRYTALRDTRSLLSCVATQNLDILHAHFGVEGMYATSVAQRLGLPLITTLHGYDVTRSRRELAISGSPAWIHYALGRRGFLSQSPSLVAVSSYIADRAVALGARREALEVVPTGVDTDRFIYCKPEDGANILHVGRLAEVKGTKYLLEAVARMVPRVPDVRLRIVGDGPLRGDLERYAESLGVSPRVEFVGFVGRAQIAEEIAWSTVVCAPSVVTAEGVAEGLGQVLLEAGAMGRPVVGTRTGGIVEVVEEGDTGILVEPCDSSELAKALIELIRDPVVSREMGVRGRKRIVERFDLGRRAAQLMELYRNLL